MVKHSIETYDIQPPNVLRPREPLRVEDGAHYLARSATRAGRTLASRGRPPLKPLLLGATAALMVGFVFDIGPWSAITGRILGTAGAQEGPAPIAPAGDLAVPSEADRAALRYFAREGDVDRLEAELRRLRALYPGWQPPRDLLDPQGEDTELQRVWDLVGEQRYEEARQAIAERRQRDPSWTPPVRLTTLLDQAEIRSELIAASNAQNYQLVLSIAQENEAILTCEDPDALWRVAEAFARTGRPNRAYDAYAYVIQNCTDPNQRASSLQKAAETLDPPRVTELFNLGATDESGQNEFTDARLDIIRGAVARGGEEEGVDVPQEWLELLADFARTGENLQDAMLVGFYLYRQGNPQEAAQWFRFALDNGLGADAAEGYIVALRATGDRENEFLAREVAYQWREQTPELMEAYLDAMATVLTADEDGETNIFDVEQASVDRFVPVVVQQRDANGAQALGWYAFNTCQFIIAEEWFISSANWVPTEAAVYGLALSRLRLGDQDGFQEVVDEWGDLYPAVAALADPTLAVEPVDPVTGAVDDPTQEVGVESVVCDPAEREQLRQAGDAGPDPVRFTEAGSLTAGPIRALAARPAGQERPAIPRRSVVLQPKPQRPKSLLVQIQDQGGAQPAQPAQPAQVEVQVQPAPVIIVPQQRDQLGDDSIVRRRALTGQGGAVTLPDGRPVRPVERRTTTVTGGNRTTAAGGSTVTRRVRQNVQPRAATVDDQVVAIVNRPRSTVRRSGGGGGGGSSGAQQALGNQQYERCVTLTDRAIRNGTLSPEEATARGYCLLELRRPIEAAQAFQLARVRGRFGSTAVSDAVYGSTLAAIATQLTGVAALEATQAPLSRPRRTELQISILTQRALAANRDGRYVEALYYLDQRNKIAPLQKDLMILQGFAYQNAGDLRSARRIFQAVNAAGPTPETRRAVNAYELRTNPQFRDTSN